MSSSYGNNYRIMTFGESHGKAVGVVIDGVKPGLKISKKEIQIELDKRKPGTSIITTSRKEPDNVEILSGIFKGKTTGHPICLVVYNKNQDSKAYEAIKDIFRPGHADYTFSKKYGIRDYRGGGRASGRETLARVAAGAIAKKIIEKNKISIVAYTKQIGDIVAQKFNIEEMQKNIIRCPDKEASIKMQEKILQIKSQGDSIGGIIEVMIKNCPLGIGEPVFDKLESELAKAMMSIGGIKGIEFGAGFRVASSLGSENNDEFTIKNNKIKLKTNNAGGILGGISTGEDIIFRLAVKPTASIRKTQNTIDLDKKKQQIQVKGRHDPCLVPRIIPVVESMASIVIADLIMQQEARKR